MNGFFEGITLAQVLENGVGVIALVLMYRLADKKLDKVVEKLDEIAKNLNVLRTSMH